MASLLVVGGCGIGGYFVYGIGAKVQDMIPGFAHSFTLVGQNWSHTQAFLEMFEPTLLPLHLENVPVKLLCGSFAKNANAGGAVLLAKSMADLEPIRSAPDFGGVAAAIITTPEAKVSKISVPMLIIRDAIPGLVAEHYDDLEKLAEFEEVGAGFCRDSSGFIPTKHTDSSCVDFEVCQQKCNALACQGMAWSASPTRNFQGCKGGGLPRCVIYHGIGASAVTGISSNAKEYTCMKRFGFVSTDSVIKVFLFGSIVETVVLFICIFLFMSASIKLSSFLLRLHHDCSRAHEVFKRNDGFIYCLVSNSPVAFASGVSIACFLHYRNSFLQLKTSLEEGNPLGHIFHALMETAKVEHPIINSLVAIFFASILAFATGLCWCLFWRRVCRTCTYVSVQILSVPTPATVKGNTDDLHLEQNTHARFAVEPHSFNQGEFIRVCGVSCSRERESNVLLRESGHRIILVPDKRSLVIHFNVQECNVQLEGDPCIQLLVPLVAAAFFSWTGSRKPTGIYLTVQGFVWFILIPVCLACVSYVVGDALIIIGIFAGAAILLAGIRGCCRHTMSCWRWLHLLSGHCRSGFGSATLPLTQSPQASIIGQPNQSERDEDKAQPITAADANVEVFADPNENYDGIDIRYLVLCPEVRRHVREQMHEDAHGYEAFFFDGFPRRVLHPAAVDRITGELMPESNAEQWSRSKMDCTDIEMTMRPWDDAIVMFNLLYVRGGLSASNFWLRTSAPLADLNRQYTNRRNEARIVLVGSHQLVQPPHPGTRLTLPNEVPGRRPPIAGHQESAPEPESRVHTALEAGRQEVEHQEINHQEADDVAVESFELVVSRTFYHLEPRRDSARRSRSVPSRSVSL